MSEETIPRVELAAPDIARWRTGNTGVAYVHSFEGPRPGAHVLITGLVHGNEICGAIAIDRLLSDSSIQARLKQTSAYMQAHDGRREAAQRIDALLRSRG